MIIRKFTPSPALQPYIHQYYLLEGDFGSHTQDVFFADGCVEIVFNLGVDFYKDDQKEDWAKFIGQITKPLEVTAAGKGKSFGIWFKPHGFSMFSPVPLSQLTNRTISLDNVFSKDFIDFAGNCLQANEVAFFVESLNIHFERLMRISQSDRKASLAQFAATQLSSDRVDMNMKALAKDANVSLRYLQKVFQETIGLSPKQFQKIARFQKTLHQITHDHQNSLTNAGYNAGYYDQSHFIREFRSFTGFRPSDYYIGNHPLNQHYLNS